ncbi:MAG: glycosyltransferase family 29 protein [Alphaproteobacteria bacterium]|jgi:glycosyltransferase involved in cell wall biosynthesis|nr:glycosyltransferase family 29 protein [Alphaproteobacteria bacterium]
MSFKNSSLRLDIKNILHLCSLVISSKIYLIKKHKKIKRTEKTVVHSLTFRDFSPNGGKGGGGAVLSAQKILLGDNYYKYAKNFPLFYSFREENKHSLKRVKQLCDLWGGVKFSYKKAKKEYNAVYITHDYATAFGLALLGKKYVYIHHLQGSRVEEALAQGRGVSKISEKIIQYCEKIAFKKAFCVCFPSNGASEEFLKSSLAKVKRNEFTLGNILYNTLYAKPNPEPIEGIFPEKDYLTFLSIGQLSYLKGIDRCVEFFTELLKKDNSKKYRYILVGKGVLQDKILLELNNLKEKYKNFSFIHLPQVSYPNILYLQEIADIYIMLHRKSIFDLATLEAMSLKKVVILSNTGGNKDFNKLNNIIMFDNENYSKVVEDFLNADLEGLSLANGYVYSAWFDNDSFIKNYHNIINKLLSPILSLDNTSGVGELQSDIYNSIKNFEKENNVLKLLKRQNYFNKSNNYPHIDLIYISYLINSDCLDQAKDSLNKYVKLYGTNHIYRFLLVANLASQMGHEDENIKKTSIIFNYLNKSYENKTLFNLLNNKSIAIVGNSDSSLGQNKGKEIDSHDIVIRFNNYQIKGFENDYGSKCNVWVRGNSTDMPSREDEVFDLIIFAADLRYYFFTEGQESVFDLLYKLIESEKKVYNCRYNDNLFIKSNIRNSTTGLKTIWEIYKTVGLKNVDFYGFDFLKEKSDKYAIHYFNDRDLSESVRMSSLHNLSLESKFLQYLLRKEGKL